MGSTDRATTTDFWYSIYLNVVATVLMLSFLDYTTPGVEHKGNYVLVKDLNLIESISKDEYQKQSPYNPNYT
jgi:hypothetical protein